MDDRGTERRGARRGIGEHQTIPEHRLEPQGSFARTDLPGLVAVGWCRGNGVVLVLAREGADERPLPKALIPPRRKQRCSLSVFRAHLWQGCHDGVCQSAPPLRPGETVAPTCRQSDG